MMLLGSVRWFSLRRGYGFIVPDNGDDDVFIHISELHKSGIKFLIPGKKRSDLLLPSIMVEKWPRIYAYID